jgi:uncharacterized protein YeaO (DUF488 family)
MKLKIETKRVHERKLKADGFRVLVSRRWPRGVPVTDIDLWLKDLGPKAPYKEKKYLAELEAEPARKAFSSLAQGINSKSLTLMCACENLKKCHTPLLKRYLTKWIGRL